MLSILNNISSLNAENSLSTTQMNLQKTLTQLSTGLKINSGSDDAAGLSIANGLQANISALTQSVQNASNGVGLLQTADGALSQVTTLLNRAVTLATEASTAGLTTGAGSTQANALDNEYQSILTEIGQIGTSTNFNGTAVFGQGQLSIALSDGTANGAGASISINAGPLTTADLSLAVGTAASVTTGTVSLNSNPSNGDTVAVGGVSYKFVTALPGTPGSDTGFVDVQIGANATASATSLADAINGTTDVTVDPGGVSGYTANTDVTASATGGALTFTSQSTSAYAITASDSAHTTLTQMVATAASTATDLTNTTDAASALIKLTNAINQVSAQRGAIGASINQLSAASAVMTNETQNLTSAQNSVQNTDIGKTVANMTQYNILQSTGMAALQQSNQAQQAVLKLLQ